MDGRREDAEIPVEEEDEEKGEGSYGRNLDCCPDLYSTGGQHAIDPPSLAPSMSDDNCNQDDEAGGPRGTESAKLTILRVIVAKRWSSRAVMAQAQLLAFGCLGVVCYLVGSGGDQEKLVVVVEGQASRDASKRPLRVGTIPLRRVRGGLPENGTGGAGGGAKQEQQRARKGQSKGMRLTMMKGQGGCSSLVLLVELSAAAAIRTFWPGRGAQVRGPKSIANQKNVNLGGGGGGASGCSFAAHRRCNVLEPTVLT